MDRNDIDEGAFRIADALQINKSIQELNLDLNPIQELNGVQSADWSLGRSHWQWGRRRTRGIYDKHSELEDELEAKVNAKLAKEKAKQKSKESVEIRRIP